MTNVPEMYELRAMYDDRVKDIVSRALKLGFDLSNPNYELGYKLGVHPQTFEDVLDCYGLLECMRKADLRGDLDSYFWFEGYLHMQYIDWYKEDSRESVYDGRYWP